MVTNVTRELEMKKFLITTGLATGIVAGGALAASAAMIDLTDITPVPNAVYTTQTGASASGSADGVTWTITPSDGGTLTYNGGGDAPGAGDGLTGEGDGIGVRGLGDVDEVDNMLGERPREYLNLVFDQEVTLTGAFYLDLFQNPETRNSSRHRCSRALAPWAATNWFRPMRTSTPSSAPASLRPMG